MVSSRLKMAITVCAASLALAGLAPGPSGAGEYHVYSCRTPSGGVAPVDGWNGTVTGSAYGTTKNTCPNGGGLLAALGDEAKYATDDEAKGTFSPPAGEGIAGATIWRAGDDDGEGVGDATYEFWLA